MKEFSEPLVSILINNYNYGHFIEESIKSVLNQSYNNCEVIVVDDGSTDNSREIIQKYSDQIISLFQENQGQASAFNAGFNISSGDIILFLDSDDFFYSDKLKTIINIFKKYPDASWLFHELEYVNKYGEVLATDNSSNIKNEQLVDFRSVFRNGGRLTYKAPATSGISFKRYVLEQILPMSQYHGVSIHDVYLKTAAMILSPGIHSPQKLATQRIHGKNLYTFQKNKPFLKAEVAIKTSFYLKEKFPELTFDKYMNKSFVRALALANYLVGPQKTLAIPESRAYLKKYLPRLNILKYIPRFIAYSIKFLFEKPY